MILTLSILDRNERPFSCSHCDARFTRKDLIKVHMMRHHQNLMPREESHTSLPQVQSESGPFNNQTNTETQWSPGWMQWPCEDGLGDIDFGRATMETTLNSGADLQNMHQDDNSLIQMPLLADNIERPIQTMPDTTWRTAFDITEAKRQEVAANVESAMQSVSLPITELICTWVSHTRHCNRHLPSAISRSRRALHCDDTILPFLMCF